MYTVFTVRKCVDVHTLNLFIGAALHYYITGLSCLGIFLFVFLNVASSLNYASFYCLVTSITQGTLYVNVLNLSTYPLSILCKCDLLKPLMPSLAKEVKDRYQNYIFIPIYILN